MQRLKPYFIQNRSAVMLLILFAFQPILDVLSFWNLELDIGLSVITVIRLLQFVGVMVWGAVLSRKKGLYILFGICTVLFALAHLWAGWAAGAAGLHEFGREQIAEDLINYIRVIQFPGFTLAFCSILQAKEATARNQMHQGFFAALVIIVLIVILSGITGIHLYTYENKSVGFLGWFYNGSAQSAIVCTLSVINCFIALDERRTTKQFVALVLGMLQLYFIATRIAYFTIFIIPAGVFLLHLCGFRIPKKTAILVLILTIFCAATFPVSPMRTNQRMVSENAVRYQNEIDELIREDEAVYGKENPLRLERAYRLHVGDLIDRFGYEKVLSAYNETDRASILHHTRKMKNTYNYLLMEEMPVQSRLFGLSYSDMTYHGNVYDNENDFIGIYYLYGIVGIGLLGLFLIGCILQIVIHLFQYGKRLITPLSVGYGGVLVTILIHCFETAGVLRRPNASIYFSAVIALIWYLLKEIRSKERVN